MSFVNEFNDLLKTLSSLASTGPVKVGANVLGKNQSIAKRASVSLCQYPVLISTRVGSENAFTVTKALEAEFANFILAYSSLNSVSDTGDFTTYVKGFHNNVDAIAANISVSAGMSENVVVANILKESMLKGNIEYLSMFNLSRLNENNPADFKPKIITKVNVEAPKVEYHAAPSEGKREYTVGITPTEIKRYNSAVPTMIKITGTVVPTGADGKSGPAVTKDFHVGVKARLEPVESSVMIGELAKGVANNNNFFNFFRANTSEISWIRDFILNVDKMKSDAIGANKGNRYFNMLQQFRRHDKILKLLTGKGLIPVTSIVFTEEEADILKAEHMIDIKNPSVARKLMADYFLIAIGIVDEAAETVQFMFDSDIEYSTYTLKSLSGGAKSNDMESLLKILRR